MMMTKSLLPSSLLSGDAESGFLPLSVPKVGKVLPRESPGDPPDSPSVPLPGVAVPSDDFEPAPERWPATVLPGGGTSIGLTPVEEPPPGWVAAWPVAFGLPPAGGFAGYPVEFGFPAEAIGTSGGFVVMGTNVGGLTETSVSTPP